MVANHEFINLIHAKPNYSGDVTCARGAYVTGTAYRELYQSPT